MPPIGGMMAEVFANIPAMIILTGVLVGLCSATLGTFLVLRGTAMMTDAISHAIVLGIVLVWMATGQTSGPLQLLGAGLAGMATVAVAQGLARAKLVRIDAAIGLVFSAFFALGVLLINLNARNLHLDVDSVLLGEIGFVWLDTVTVAGLVMPRAIVVLTAVLALNLTFVLVLWKELKLSTFDPALAAALGFAPALVGLGLIGLTSITAVAAFDAVGVVLFMAFVIVPPATAFLLVRQLWAIMVLALAIAVLSAPVGYALAVYWDVSIGGMMALATGGFFALAFALGPREGLLARARQSRILQLDRDASALVAHLCSHNPGGRTTGAALRADLQWSVKRMRQATLRALDRGLVQRSGDALVVQPKGQAEAHARLQAAKVPTADIG
jgi:manganese/zinc/iron transport system permease protein